MTSLPAATQSQPQPTASDRVDLVGLVTRQPSPDAPTNQVEFQATVNYRLQSAPSGFVLLFLFENSANDSTQQSSQGIEVQRGTGQLVLKNDFAAEEQNLTQAIQDSPETGNYYWRADTRIRLNHFADALVDFNRSIDLMPQDRPSRVGRGIANLWLGQAQAAIDDLSFAIDASQNYRLGLPGAGPGTRENRRAG